ncbi:MAG: NUDIX domain-containing protein, partial [Croceibacterium sp.]
AIAFGQRAVVVDANVERVVARLFAIDTPLPAARPAIRAAADRITPAQRSGDFAQAMMDLGSSLCAVREPRCLLCPLAEDCQARAQGRQAELPVKAQKKPKPVRRGRAWWVEHDGQVLLVTRPPSGMLGGMKALPDDGWSAKEDGSGEPPLAGDWTHLGTVRHVFTHFALELDVMAWAGGQLPQGEWHPVAGIEQAGLPTLFAKAAVLAKASR